MFEKFGFGVKVCHFETKRGSVTRLGYGVTSVCFWWRVDFIGLRGFCGGFLGFFLYIEQNEKKKKKKNTKFAVTRLHYATKPRATRLASVTPPRLQGVTCGYTFLEAKNGLVPSRSRLRSIFLGGWDFLKV